MAMGATLARDDEVDPRRRQESPEPSAGPLSSLGPWLAFLIRRLLTLVMSALILIVVTFLLMHLIGGDPVRASLGFDAPQALVDLRRTQLHLDEPLINQFLLYVGQLAHFQFGDSITTGTPVVDLIGPRLLNTLALTSVTMAAVALLTLVIGLSAGALTRDGRNGWFGLFFGTVTSFFVALPIFLLATVLVYIFAVTLGWLPVAGMSGPESFVLPAVALGLPTLAYLSRTVRGETAKVLSTEYIATARSKHLPARVLYPRHVVRNSLTNALTVAGIAFGVMLTGGVVIEEIFAWPGIGSAAVTAIQQRDYPTAQAIILLLGLIVLVVNTLVDVCIALLDPRSVIAEA